MRARINSATLIHAGYITVLAFIAIAAVEVFRLQSASTNIRLQAYERFVDQSDVASSLRRHIWLAANTSRDFLLDVRADRETRFESQLSQIRSDARAALAVLDTLDPGRTQALALRTRVLTYLDSLSNVSASGQLREFVPHRTTALDAIEDFTQQTQMEMHRVLATVSEQRRETTNRIFALVCAVFLVALAVAAFTARYAIRRERERQRLLDDTAKVNAELAQLSAKLFEVQEEERRALARDLHDDLGQLLTALRMEISHSLAQSAADASRSRLERARSLAETAVSTVRNISLMLRPALLDDLGLAAALQWQLEQLKLRSGIETRLIANESGEHLSDSVRTCVFRTAQEALNNCEKYAGATIVEVTLEVDENSLALRVEDDGRGFSTAGSPRGAGLIGLRERAAHLGGACAVESSEGGGTRILLTLPHDRKTTAMEVL